MGLFYVDGVENGHEYVDLGLPSGTKWAACNIGANKPEEYGDYFAWGETKAKQDYTPENSRTFGKKRNDISGSTRYDAARVNWGGNWRMPTAAEINELGQMCKWTKTTRNGVSGCQVIGPNGNSIFLPSAGKIEGVNFVHRGEWSSFWGATPYSADDTTYSASFGAVNGHPSIGIDERYNGKSLRPVIK